MLPAPKSQPDRGSVFVQGKFMNRQIMKMFLNFGGYTQAASPEDANFVVWTGGEDVWPGMYNQVAIPGTYFNRELDIADLDVYQRSFHGKDNKLRIGICRGAQLLNILNGGSLWQNVDGHHAPGEHKVTDKETGRSWIVNTDHHQQLILPKVGGFLIAYTDVSTHKENALCNWDIQHDVGDGEVDVEVAWFPKTACLCFQPHPEYPHEETRAYFFDLLERYRVPF